MISPSVALILFVGAKGESAFGDQKSLCFTQHLQFERLNTVTNRTTVDGDRALSYFGKGHPRRAPHADAVLRKKAPTNQ